MSKPEAVVKIGEELDFFDVQAKKTVRAKLERIDILNNRLYGKATCPETGHKLSRVLKKKKPE
jgi:hypothetical protein